MLKELCLNIVKGPKYIVLPLQSLDRPWYDQLELEFINATYNMVIIRPSQIVVTVIQVDYVETLPDIETDGQILFLIGIILLCLCRCIMNPSCLLVQREEGFLGLQQLPSPSQLGVMTSAVFHLSILNVFSS